MRIFFFILIAKRGARCAFVFPAAAYRSDVNIYVKDSFPAVELPTLSFFADIVIFFKYANSTKTKILFSSQCHLNCYKGTNQEENFLSCVNVFFSIAMETQLICWVNNLIIQIRMS